MKVVYHCFGGTHSSPVAAAIHLGLLPRSRPPTAGELMGLAWFDRVGADGWGHAVEVGQDAGGHRIFVMGHGPGGAVAVRALRSGYEMAAGGNQEGLLLVDTLACVNWPMRVGGFLSRRMGLVSLGRPLVIWGTQRAFPRLVQLVQRVEQELRSGGEGVQVQRGQAGR